MDKSLLGWLLLLGLGFPLLSILLSEAASRLERQQHPLAVALRVTAVSGAIGNAAAFERRWRFLDTLCGDADLGCGHCGGNFFNQCAVDDKKTTDQVATPRA